MRILDLCNEDVVVARPRESLRRVARRMVDRGVGALVVVDALNHPLGIVTDRDLMRHVAASGRDPGRTRVEEVMSGPAVWIRETASVEDALGEMARLRVRRLPVIDASERLAGIFTLDDALRLALPPESPAGRALRANLEPPAAEAAPA